MGGKDVCARKGWSATCIRVGRSRQVGGEDAEEYKRAVRTRLRELVDRAGEPQAGAAPDWLVVYASPLAAGPASKTAGKARPCTTAPGCFTAAGLACVVCSICTEFNKVRAFMHMSRQAILQKAQRGNVRLHKHKRTLNCLMNRFRSMSWPS